MIAGNRSQLFTGYTEQDQTNFSDLLVRGGDGNEELRTLHLKDWKRFILPDSSSSLQMWDLTSPLKEIHQVNHLAKFPKRLAQRLIHRFLLAWLDARRKSWTEDAYPQHIPKEIVARLERELGVG